MDCSDLTNFTHAVTTTLMMTSVARIWHESLYSAKERHGGKFAFLTCLMLKLFCLCLIPVLVYTSSAVANINSGDSYQPAAIAGTSSLTGESAGRNEELLFYVDVATPPNYDTSIDAIDVFWSANIGDAAQFQENPQEVIVDGAGQAYLRFSVIGRFFESGTVVITARAFSNDPQIFQTVGNNEVDFTFDIEAPYSEQLTDPVGVNGENDVRENDVNGVNGVNGEPDTTMPSNVNLPLSVNQSEVMSACNSTTQAQAQAQLPEQLQGTCNLIGVMADPRSALDRVVPDEIFSIADTLTLTVDQQLGNIHSRIMAVRTGQRKAFDISALNLKLWDKTIPSVVLSQGSDALSKLAGGAASADSLRDSAVGVFTNGNISVGEVDGDGIQQNADISTSHFTLGADYRLSSNRVIGAALSIASDDTDFQADNGELEMQGFGLSAFGSWYKKDAGYADIIVDISQQKFDLTRRINLVGMADEFANGSTTATRFAVAVNVGRTIQRGANEFGPMARISIMQASVGEFTESSTLTSNSAGTALQVDSHQVSSARFAVGGEFKRVVNTKKAVLVPSARLLLHVENQTEKDAITASFVNDINNTEMRFQGAERDSSSLLLNLGTTAVFRGAQSAFINFQTRLQDERVSQNQVRPELS